MNRPASTTSAPSATSADTSSRSGATRATARPSSGPRDAPPAAPGTDTPSITDTGSTPSTPPPADGAAGPAARAGTAHATVRHRAFRILRSAAAELLLLRELLPAAVPDLSARAVARWQAQEGPACPRCGDLSGPGVPGAVPPVCAGCIAAPPPFHAARSLFRYAGDVRTAILAAKYAGRPFPSRAVAGRIGDALATRWGDLIPDRGASTVVPVPLHPWKYLRRGFNLPALIASHLARDIGAPFNPRVLCRVRNGTPQATLPLPARARNVAAVFRVRSGTVPPTRVLLVDDVYTSGATVRAAASALKSGGADHIVVVTIARTVL